MPGAGRSGRTALLGRDRKDGPRRTYSRLQFIHLIPGKHRISADPGSLPNQPRATEPMSRACPAQWAKRLSCRASCVTKPMGISDWVGYCTGFEMKRAQEKDDVRHGRSSYFPSPTRCGVSRS